MKRGTALALVAGLFLLGAVVGVLGTHLFYAHRLAEPGSLADLAIDLTARKVERRLDLTPDQRREMTVILDDARADIAILRGEMVDGLRDVRARSAARLEAILDDEQRRELEELRREHGDRFDSYLQ